MNLKSILQDFQVNKTIPLDFILSLEENYELRAEIVQQINLFKNRDFAIILLEECSKIRRQPYPDNYEIGCEVLMFCCYVLGLHNQIEDCLKVWLTKTIDFDTFSGIDVQLVVFAGVKETLEFIKDKNEDAYKYISECLVAGDFNLIEDYYLNPWFV